MKNLLGPVPVPERRVAEEHQQGLAAFSPPLNQYYAAGSFVNEGPNFRDHWRAVRRHLALVIGLTLLLTSGVGVYMAFKPDIYEAEAQVQVNLENINPQLSGMKGGSFIVNPVNDPAYFNTQLQLLVRPWLLRRVVKTLDIEHDPAFQLPPQGQSNSAWRRLLGSLGMNRDANSATHDFTQTGGGQESVSTEELAEATRLAPYVETIQDGLSVQPVKENRLPIKDTRLINIAFSHTDPQIAAKIVNTLADTFVRSNLENKNDVNAMTRDILHKRITELKTQVRSGEEQLINYAEAHEIISLDPSQNTVVERLAGLNRQLLEAENDRKLAEAAYQAALVPGAAEALAESATAKDSAEPENRLAELRQRRAQLLVESTEEWPEVKEIDQQIAALEKYVEKSRERAGSVVRTNLETKYRQALAGEQALRNAFNRQRGDTLKQNEAAIYYRMMQQEVETGKQLLDGLLQRQKENDGLLAGMINNIRINDYAVVPKVPIGPRRILYSVIAFTISLAFSLGLAVLIDYMDNTVRTSEDVEKTLHARTLASIPLISDVATRQLLQVSHARSITGALHNRLLPLSAILPRLNGNATNHGPLLLDDDRGSWLNEVYRQLRTSMLLSNEAGALQTILVTASLPSEGKTTTAINTALSLARTGAKVLLIDADTRNPRIHRLLGLGNEQGLTTVFSNRKVEHELSSLIKRHEPSGLFVLTSGPAEPNFTELLGSQQMVRVMSDLRSNFKYIIIDSPPVAHFADGIMISQMVDGVLLVVNSGRTPREVVRQSQQVLLDVGANIIGVVLNNVKILPYDYNYYPKYYARRNENGRGEHVEVEHAGESSILTTHYLIDRQIFPDESGPAGPNHG